MLNALIAPVTSVLGRAFSALSRTEGGQVIGAAISSWLYFCLWLLACGICDRKEAKDRG